MAAMVDISRSMIRRVKPLAVVVVFEFNQTPHLFQLVPMVVTVGEVEAKSPVMDLLAGFSTEQQV
jgi:hypothetical protein